MKRNKLVAAICQDFADWVDNFDGKSKNICNFLKIFQEKFCELNKIY